MIGELFFFTIKLNIALRRPVVLRKRKQVSEEDPNAKPIEINTEATGIELHKDSKYDQLFHPYQLGSIFLFFLNKQLL